MADSESAALPLGYTPMCITILTQFSSFSQNYFIIFMMIRILVADDEEMIRELIRKYAVHEGYECVTASNGVEALALFEREHFDVVILDVMMPEMDGFETLKRMNEIRETHCILLTALGSEDDRIYGFQAGCDDYVIKPFSPKELMMRIKVILRRNSIGEDVICFDGFRMDLSAHSLTIDGNEVNLSNKEYELLQYLITNRGRAMTRESIIMNVWGYAYDSDDRTLDTHMKLLRKDLGRFSSMITTIRGVGYRFEKES